MGSAGDRRHHRGAGDTRAARAQLPADRANRLIAQAAAAWFNGDVDEARRAGAEAEPIALEAGLESEARGAIQVQVMVAHSTGEWSDAVRQSLEGSMRAPELADTLFDGHLCVAEYALTSGEPHERLRAMGEELHAHAVRSGARRAQAFAATLLGELALAAHQLSQAEERLEEAARLSREIGAVAGEALATARLGEAVCAAGDRGRGEALIADALVISRWSPLSHHLQPLAFSALLRGTEDPGLALERLDDAEAQMRDTDGGCAYCGHAFSVASGIASARAGQLDRAATALASAEATSALWEGGPWPAALDEVRGEIAQARGESAAALELLRAASSGFSELGWPLEASRVDARLLALT